MSESMINIRVKIRKVVHNDKLFDVVVMILLAVTFIVALYPLYFVVIASISDAHFVNRGEVLLYPKQIHFSAYTSVLSDPRILSGYKNTIIYTVFGTLLSVFITILAAFPLSRKELLGKKFFTWFFLFTMYFNGGLIPTYLQVKSLGLVNTRAAVIIVGSLGIWNLIIARSFFSNNIPDELWEAASIDGCSMYQFFWKVVLPISKSIIAILVLYYAVAQWSDYFKGLIYLNKSSFYPLQLILRDILLAGEAVSVDVDPASMREMTKKAEVIKYAIIIVSSLPVIAIYPFVQKHFVKGVMVGSLKG